MKKFPLLLLGLCLFGLPALAQDAVRLGMDPGPYPPFTSKAADGRRIGFEPELLDAICRAMKANCQIVEITWDGLMSALASSKIDVIYNDMTITEARKARVDFSDPYYDTGVVFAGGRADKVEISPAGLKGKILGVTSGTIHEAYARAKFGEVAEIKLYPGLPELNADLVAGRVDVGLADALAMAEFLKTPAGQSLEVKARAPKDPLLGSGVGAAFRKGDDGLRQRFNAALAAVIASGEYQRIRQKFFDVDIQPRG